MSSFLYKKSGMESLSIPESIYPDPWEKKTGSNPLPENQESTEISSTD